MSQSERRRRLEAARLTGAGLLATFALLAVDMPEGYLGAADELTPWGWAYAGATAALTALAVGGRFARRPWAPRLAPVLLSLHIGVFVAPIASDPVLAGGVVGWSLLQLSHWLFPRPLPRRLEPPAGALESWLGLNAPALRHLLGVSLALSIAVLGYRLGERWPALLFCLALDGFLLALSLPLVRHLWRAGRRLAPLALAALLAAALAAAASPSWALGALAGYQAVALALLMARSASLRQLADSFYARPALLVLASFLVLIAAGTLLLSFPAAAAGAGRIAPIDALFTATSAACVTGLVVIDTPGSFSGFGEAVILGLIQAGGLNIMVLSTFAAVALGRSLGLRGERALGELLDLQPERSAYPLTRFIVLSTLAVEAAGAAVLTLAYLLRGEPWGGALWKGVFHSVSAFCNAGFALHSDSLIGFRDSPLVLATVALLITAGGLGFGVLAAAWLGSRGERRALSVQARLVLWVSGALVVVGTLLYAAGEWRRSLAGLGTLDKWMNAFFQSVTLRTAGFQSVGFEELAPATLVMMLVWMLVGASPGGTGGGIKTTTAAVLLSVIPAIARGRARVVLFHRQIALETVYRSAAIAVVTLVLTALAAALLLATQPLSFEVALFEAVSAVATVGLSLGATAVIDTLGKAVIVAVMLLGRIGPLSMVLLLARREPSRLRYPEARVMVG